MSTPVTNPVRYPILACTLVGALLSAFSLRNHYATDVTQYCDLNALFNCDLVNRSIYSEFLGLPVALIGLLGYTLLFLLSLRNDKRLAILRFVSAAFGFIFAVRLAYIEARVLAVWCLLCIGSLAMISAITVLSAIALWQDRILKPQQAEARAKLG